MFGNVDSISKERVEELNAFDRFKGERGLVAEEKARKSLVTNELEKSICKRSDGDKSLGSVGLKR